MNILNLILLFWFSIIPSSHATAETVEAKSNWERNTKNSGRIIDVNGGPESVIWVVQLSDLHFSINHPERALDFKKFVGPALSMIKPSLVLITGDLTDGKSNDLLTMKQNEEEWVEYKSVMEDVVNRSRLDKSIFFDLRGNHDNFGVPAAGGSYDFFSKYSINGQLGRSSNVNSITLQNCRALVKAYEMNPILHFPGYSLTVPILLASAVYETGKI